MYSVERLWDDVELAVCRVCADNTLGTCRLSGSGRCALQTHFASVVRAVDSVTSSSYAPYVTALRDQVCTECRYMIAGGRCPRREHAECALDRYYPLVIDAIEEGLYGNPIAMTMARR